MTISAVRSIPLPVQQPAPAPAPAVAAMPTTAAQPQHDAAPQPAVDLAPAGPAPMQSPFAAPEDIMLPTLALPGSHDPGNSKPGAPPAPGSLLQAAELKILHVVQDHRTPEGDAWANRLDARFGLPVWFHELGELRQSHGIFAAAKGAALLTGVMATNTVITELAKRKFDRERPYDADPTIIPVVPRPHDASFPSGHTSNAFAAARVFSLLEPERTVELYKLATEVAASRVYAGVHYPTDVIAGALIGTAVAQKFIDKLSGH